MDEPRPADTRDGPSSAAGMRGQRYDPALTTYHAHADSPDDPAKETEPMYTVMCCRTDLTDTPVLETDNYLEAQRCWQVMRNAPGVLYAWIINRGE